MSLLQDLPFSLYQDLIKKNDWSRWVVKNMNLRNIRTSKDLINALDRRGYTLKQFNEILENYNNSTLGSLDENSRTQEIQHKTGVKMKIAILVANINYEHWSDLITPLSDCEVLGDILKAMGFYVIILKNLNTIKFKKAIEEVCRVIPAKSYVLFYFAGHGFELCGTKYMLGIESPLEQYTTENGISENLVIKNGFHNKPELFILLLDMCRTQPDRLINKEIYSNICPVEECGDICNLIIGYATSPYMPAYEECCADYSTSRIQHDSCKSINSIDIGNKTTYKMDASKKLNGVSLYVSFLSLHLKKNEDFVKILDMVHKDFAKLQCEQAILQKPQKLDNVAKYFYLHQKATGDKESEEKLFNLISKLQSEEIDIILK